MSNDRDPWFEDRYDGTETPPEHLNEEIRDAAHGAARRRVARWYAAGTAASLFMAVALYVTVIQDTPESVLTRPSMVGADGTGGPADKASGPGRSASAKFSTAAADAGLEPSRYKSTMAASDAPIEADLARKTQSPVPPAAMATEQGVQSATEEVVATGSHIRRAQLDQPDTVDDTAHGARGSTEQEYPFNGPRSSGVPSCVSLSRENGPKGQEKREGPARPARPEREQREQSPALCLSEQAGQSLMLWIPGDHGCPGLLDLNVPPPSTAPVVMVHGNPLEVTVMGQHFICRDGAWLQLE